jgi:hypothetical protein
VLTAAIALGARMRRFRVVMHLWLDELAATPAAEPKSLETVAATPR